MNTTMRNMRMKELVAGAAVAAALCGCTSQIQKNQEEASQFNEKFSNLGER